MPAANSGRVDSLDYVRGIQIGAVAGMSIDNLAVFFGINLLCYSIASAVLRGSGFYRRHLSALAAARHAGVDGLRGWLALGVFMTHVAATYFFYTEGKWGSKYSGFLTMTGEVGVSLFFMITGFLFWGRVLRNGGLGDVPAFLVSRVRRIVPMYLVSAAMVLLVIAVASGFQLRTEPVELLREIRAWLSFGFLDPADTNGVVAARSINFAYWTLAYEWSFYLALPLLALFARGRTALLLLTVAFVYCAREPITLNFIAGAIAALSVHKGWFRNWFAHPAYALLAITALACTFLFLSAYALPPIVLLAVFFLIVANGNDLFGLLSSKGSRLLGTISYSLYLVNCVVIYVIMHLVNLRWPIASLGVEPYLVFAALAAVVTVGLSAVTYRYVEYPFLASRSAPGQSLFSTARSEERKLSTVDSLVVPLAAKEKMLG
jgi:peptidoglycan/LPS O-acetylase OafA/YrhL